MKKGLHPRNIHNEKYDFDALIKSHPELSSFVSENQYGDLGIDFSDSNGVLCLNQALITHHYNVDNWTIPQGHLCPPIPGRADYIHYLADLLAEKNNGVVPVGTKVKGLDIGTGTSCIYPILGNCIYGWKFVGTDIDSNAINNGKNILNFNQGLKKNIKTRFQKSSEHIFKNMIKAEEKFDFTMCNPPFYSSLEEAKRASSQKVNNLNINKQKKNHPTIKDGKNSNFGGKRAELWCSGGESAFIKKMIEESVDVREQCGWFSTLVSNKEHLSEFYPLLEQLKCADVRTIEMHHGHKIVNILTWCF